MAIAACGRSTKDSFFLIMPDGLDAIQKREAYFGCIAAPDGNCEGHAPARLPSSS